MRAVFVSLAIGLFVGHLVVGVVPAAAQDDPPTGDAPVEVSDAEPATGGGIIPKPNSGAAPQRAGDRGGALQLALLGLLLLFPVVAFFSIRRQARRARQGSGV